MPHLSGNIIPCGTASGIASVTTTGGVGPYTYAWNSTPVQTTSVATGLTAGAYMVNITDSRGCTFSKTATVGNINPPAVSITGITGICPGSATTLCAPVGMTSYLWSNGDTTRCTSVTTSGNYSVTITDYIGCKNSKTVATTMSTYPSSTITGNGTLCPGNWLTLRAPLGYPTYTWSNGAHTSSITVRTGGVYSVTVKNASNCASTSSVTVLAPLKITVAQVNGTCSNAFGGAATVTATAGVAPYTYYWSNGATTSSVKGLPAGPFSVTVTDELGCIATYSSSIVITKLAGDYSTGSADFNNTLIPANSYLWFSAFVKINYTGSYPVTLTFINQNISSSRFNINPINAKLILTNSVSQATTIFTGTEWITTAPPNVTGRYFISAATFKTLTPILANLTTRPPRSAASPARPARPTRMWPRSTGRETTHAR